MKPTAPLDPVLELHDADGDLLASNDNWKDTQETEIEATGLAPTNDAESALLQTLPSGAYTAIVRGAGDTTGVGLVEVYNLATRSNELAGFAWSRFRPLVRGMRLARFPRD